MQPILIVDDEIAITRLISLVLTQAGYPCVTANSGTAAANEIEQHRFDLVLLDIMLPEIDGYELIEYAKQYEIPAIFITAKTDVVDRVKGLRMGADDYIVKPFEPAELVARVETVLRRTGRANCLLRAGQVTLDPATRLVQMQGKEVSLTPKEFELLSLLMRNCGKTLYRDYLFDTVWGEEADDISMRTRTLDTHIQRLRRKLCWGKKIETLRKVGYLLLPDKADDDIKSDNAHQKGEGNP
ncbi:MAG: response regulator transcription factor [Ruthenibacterium sp.]